MSASLTAAARLRLLCEVTAIASQGRGLAASADRIAAAVRRDTGCSVVAIELFDRNGTTTMLAGWAGPALAQRVRKKPVPLAPRRAAWLRRKRTPVVAGRADLQRLGIHSAVRGTTARSFLLVPIRADGEPAGVLDIGFAVAPAFTKEMLRFFSALGASLSWQVSRKRAAEALATSKDRYQHLFEDALDAIFMIDPADTRILDANARARALTGLSVKALRARTLLDLAPDQEAAEHRTAYARLAAEGEILGIRSLHFVRPRGSPAAIDLNAHVISVGERRVALAIVRDITEQKKAEVQLTASEELLRIIVEGTLDMFFYVHNRQGIFTYVSPSVERITGHTVAEWMTRYDTFATDSPVNVRMQEYTQQALEKGLVSPPYLCEIWHADGRRILLEVNERPIFRDGAVIGVQGVARDITERRKLEEQLIQSQKMESIGLLAGGIAHDFNNILGGILGYASYLKSVVPADDPNYQHIDTIERSALRAADLTSKLLAFARGGKYVVKPININDVVEETLRLLRGSLDKSIMIREELDRSLPAVEADAGQMQQVVMNLCVNARDAMPGGGRLTVSTRVVSWQIPFLLSQPDVRHVPYVSVTVEDSGVGIDEAIRGKIFDPFFTTKEKGKGTGLGLATVYGIVKNHNGYIDMQSEIGRGTSFSVLLPGIEREAVTSEERLGVVSGGNETILVVDDEETIRRLLRDLLGAKGYTVLEAVDGREALRVFASHRASIRLVILDMVMPVMGGRDTYIRLREMEPGIRTILCTGYAEDERARELMAMGVRAFVQKPYRVEELAAVVRSVLDAPTGGA